jgi:hypothetical protein
MTYRRKNAGLDQHGDEIEVSRLPGGYADDLLRFNITGQRIADLCNRERVFFPWDNEVHRSTWHRALKGEPVWYEVVDEILSLHDQQQRNPRAFLPGPPTKHVLDWMSLVAGFKWWAETLSLDTSPNLLSSWKSRGVPGSKKKKLKALRKRVADWWARVDAACTQADMVRSYHAMHRRERARESRQDWDVVIKHPDSFDSYFYTYVQEDGHTVDDARERYVEMADLARNHRLHMIDLKNPGLIAVRSTYQDPSDTPEAFAQEFDRLWARGLDEAMPRDMPEGTDLSDTMHEGQWPDRRAEEGPKDVNAGLYKKWYRERTSWAWSTKERRRVVVSSEVIEVSENGQSWRPAYEYERKGWDCQGLEIARYREEYRERPLNSYDRELEEARLALRQVERQDDVSLEKVRRAREVFERAQGDY